MDALQKLAFDASESVAVLGRGGRFFLVPLNAKIVINNFKFCGCFGLVDGEPKIAAESLDPDSLLTLAAAGVHWATQRAAQLPHDSEDWLERLYRLPDPRD
jgi:hypothetical protein